MEAIRDGIAQSIKMSTLSYNHPTWWLQKAYPGKYFHMECMGDALVEKLDEVQAVYDGGVVHLEAGHGQMFGMASSASSTARSRSWTACPRSPNSVSPCILRTSGTSTSTPTASKHLPPRRIEKDC